MRLHLLGRCGVRGMARKKGLRERLEKSRGNGQEQAGLVASNHYSYLLCGGNARPSLPLSHPALSPPFSISAWVGTKPKERDRKGSAKAITTATRGSSRTACNQSGSALRSPPHGAKLPSQPSQPPECSSAPPGGRKALADAGTASQCACSGHSCAAAAAAVARPTAAAAALPPARCWLPAPWCCMVAVRARAQPAKGQ